MKNETGEVWKSALIGTLALVALICWLVFQPRLPDVKPKEKIGQKLLESFDDPGEMTRVEFTRINPSTGELQQLVLVRDGDVWRLPSMTNFPAENAEQVAKVVAPLVQLLVLDVVAETIDSSNAAKTDRFHRECGLLNPNNFDPDLEFVSKLNDEDSEGVETAPDLAHGSALAVKINGADGEPLVDLLIGERVPESSATRDNRFVRFSTSDARLYGRLFWRFHSRTRHDGIHGIPATSVFRSNKLDRRRPAPYQPVGRPLPYRSRLLFFSYKIGRIWV